MTRYVWWQGDWREVDENRPRPKSMFPAIHRDIEYMSPLGTGLISSRSQRREELKRNNLREVDPGEWVPRYHNKKFAAKHGKTWTPAPERQADSRDPQLDGLKG